jgi:hypothetical protein
MKLWKLMHKNLSKLPGSCQSLPCGISAPLRRERLYLIINVSRSLIRGYDMPPVSLGRSGHVIT